LQVNNRMLIAPRALLLAVLCFTVCICSCGGNDILSSPETVTPVITTTLPEPTTLPTRTTAPTRVLSPTPRYTATPAPTATPFITPPQPGGTVAIPILMYHHLTALDANASETLRTWTVAPNQFAAQLDYLQQRGFHTITLHQLVDFFENGKSLPTNPIVLTFDDAWIDDYNVAFPELRKRDMVGVFFVPTAYVQAGGELLLNWDMVLEMDRAGMDIEGHTINHMNLSQANLVEVRRQLVDSKQILEEKLGHPILALSYPFGAFNSKIIAETQNAGYRAGVILCCGYEQQSDRMFLLPRIRVSYGDTLEDFAKRLP